MAKQEIPLDIEIIFKKVEVSECVAEGMDG